MLLGKLSVDLVDTAQPQPQPAKGMWLGSRVECGHGCVVPGTETSSSSSGPLRAVER